MGRKEGNHVLSFLQRQADHLRYGRWRAVGGTGATKVTKTLPRLKTGVLEACNGFKKKLSHECFIVTVEKLHDAEKPKNKNYLLIIPHLGKKKITVHILVQFLPRSSSPLHIHTHVHTCTHISIYSIGLHHTCPLESSLFT